MGALGLRPQADEDGEGMTHGMTRDERWWCDEPDREE